MNKAEKQLFWISGGIDPYGHITAHEGYSGDVESLGHTDKEKAHSPWRWNVCQQEFMQPLLWQKRHLTEEELGIVKEWLVYHNYVEEDIMFKWYGM